MISLEATVLLFFTLYWMWFSNNKTSLPSSFCQILAFKYVISITQVILHVHWVLLRFSGRVLFSKRSWVLSVWEFLVIKLEVSRVDDESDPFSLCGWFEHSLFGNASLVFFYRYHSSWPLNLTQTLKYWTINLDLYSIQGWRQGIEVTTFLNLAYIKYNFDPVICFIYEIECMFSYIKILIP